VLIKSPKPIPKNISPAINVADKIDRNLLNVMATLGLRRERHRSKPRTGESREENPLSGG
jgi:hypothetical protein